MAYSEKVGGSHENPAMSGSFEKVTTRLEPAWWVHRRAAM